MHTNTSFCQTVLQQEKQMDLRDSDPKNTLKLMCGMSWASWLLQLSSSILSVKQYANLTNRMKAIYEHINTDEVFSLWFKAKPKGQFISSSSLLSF